MRKTRTRATALTAFAVAVAGSVAGAAEAPHNLRAYPGQQYESLIQSSAAQASTAQVPHHSANAADRSATGTRSRSTRAASTTRRSRRRDPRLRRAARPRPREPRDGDRPHRDLRGGRTRIGGGYKSYTALPRARGASHATPRSRRRRTTRWSCMFPSQARAFDVGSRRGPRDASGTVAARRPRASRSGRRAAAAILALRADDGSQHPEPRVGIDYIPSDGAGQVAAGSDQPDPARARRALGRGQAVRARVGRPVPRAAAAGARQRRRTPRRTTR